MPVTAIIPCYNAQKTIVKAVDSVLKQTAPVSEIIIVNDGSTDGSREILDRLAQKYKTVKVIHQDNKGVSAARNIAIVQATGTYILTLDADDFFENTFVEKALLKFTENDAYGAVMCGYVRVVNGKKVMPYIPAPITLQYCLLYNGALSCLLFKKEALLAAGLYDTAMRLGYEDWDLNISMLKAGYQYGIVKEILFNYVDVVGSRTYTASRNDLDLKMQIYTKHSKEYLANNEYMFKEFVTETARLKKQLDKIKKRKSYRWSQSIIKHVEQLKRIVKSS